jgi:Fe-S cluster biogenesis protein NfuA
MPADPESSSSFRADWAACSMHLAGPMVTPERVEAILGRLRPLLQSDGGDIELVDVTGNRARVRMSGACAGCPSGCMTLDVGLEWALKEDMPEFEELIVV